MTNETKRRIAHYQKSLPAMREKVLGAVLMLFIAVLTAVSATYAWVTLSAAPEATSIDTTVTANGARVELTYKEFELLKYLMKNPNTIIKHYLKSDALLFNPVSSINGYVYTYSFGELKYLPKYTKINTKIPVLKNMYDKYINLSLHKLFIIFYEPAFILYLSLIITITLSKKVYGKKIWLFITPMLMNTISLIPINLAQDLRYVYINYLTFFGLLLMFILNYSKILKKKRV